MKKHVAYSVVASNSGDFIIYFKPTPYAPKEQWGRMSHTTMQFVQLVVKSLNTIPTRRRRKPCVPTQSSTQPSKY